MKKKELANKIAKRMQEESRNHRQHERALELLNVNARVESAKRLVDITRYDGDKSLHMRIADPCVIGLNKREIESLENGFPAIEKAINWLMIHKRSRIVLIGGPDKEEPYKSDKMVLGDKLAKWNGWKVDLISARVWNSRGKEASYSTTRDGYINVNGMGLHRLVMMAYLIVRARSESKYMKMCQELVQEKSPYQVHHLYPSNKTEREFNGIRSITLERVEKNRPNQHQIYNNIGRIVKKHLNN